MTTLLDETPAPPETTPAQRLRATMAAVRVMFTWYGVRKSLSAEQKAQAADAFGAEGNYLSAGKKLIDTSHSAFKAVTAVRSQVLQFWRSLTVPFPEPGIRLIRRDEIGLFDVKMTSLRQDLVEAVANLDNQFADLKAAARRRLGRLFSAADYPESLVGLFHMAWEYPNVEPPSYLRQLSPALYEEEANRVAARFDEAVALAEHTFTQEFGNLVSHLTERLSGGDDGKERVFRDSAVENLAAFFGRFKHLNVRSSEQLDQLVEQAQRIVRGVQPQALRDDNGLRQRIASQLAGVQSQVEGMLVDRPRRRILRLK